MENRRSSDSKSFGQKKYYDRNRSSSPTQYGNHQKNDNRGQGYNRDNNDRFHSRNGGDRQQPRDGGGNRFQSRDDRSGGYQPRDGGGYRKSGPGGGNANSGGRKFFSKGGPPQRGRFPSKNPKPWQQPENNIKIVSDMQLTDGKHRGKYFQSTDSPTAVPTPRRIREIMFKILFRRIRAGRVLDLCAGSGTIGLEAISRGAMISTFVERSARMCSFIKKNLEAIGIKEGHGEICEMEVVPFLKRAYKRRRFWDVVYFAIPRNEDGADIFDCLGRGTSINPGGTLVVEHDAENSLPERLGILKRWRVVVQDDRALSFYQRKAN